MNLTDRRFVHPDGLLCRAVVSILATAALLVALPAGASAAVVDYRLGGAQLLVYGDLDESNAYTVSGEGGDLRIRDERHDIRGGDDRCTRRSSRDVICPSPSGGVLSIAGSYEDDVITVDLASLPPRGVSRVFVDPGRGRDRVQFVNGNNGAPTDRTVQLDIGDGKADDVSCGNWSRFRVSDRDAEDRIDRDCNVVTGDGRGAPAPPARDGTPARIDLYTRRAQRRGSVLRLGLKAVCSATEAGTCSITGSISRSAARALGIRTRARRYPVLRGSTAVPAAGPNKVRAKLSRRAQAALRGRRVRGLRVLLTATMRDRAGNLSTNQFTVTLRG